MTRYQRDTHVADIHGLRVYVARWPGMPTDTGRPKPPEVMWRDGSVLRYLPPQAARRFAAALVKAADQIEAEGQPAE